MDALAAVRKARSEDTSVDGCRWRIHAASILSCMFRALHTNWRGAQHAAGAQRRAPIADVLSRALAVWSARVMKPSLAETEVDLYENDHVNRLPLEEPRLKSPLTGGSDGFLVQAIPRIE
jgi:hypothetical protein